jgi:hypothetical protein
MVAIERINESGEWIKESRWQLVETEDHSPGPPTAIPNASPHIGGMVVARCIRGAGVEYSLEYSFSM